MKVIVTGATGFLGGYVARRYAERGDDVVATGRNSERGRALERDGVHFLPADLTAPGDWMTCFDGADIVVHCAALSSLKGTYQMFHASNVVATEHVVRACETSRVGRLVNISTPSIYHCGEHRRDIKESDPLPARFANQYTQTKWQAEQSVQAAHARGLGAITLRPRAIFGPGDPSIVPRIIRVLKSGRLRVIGDGKNVVDVTCVDNVVDAVVCAGESHCSGEAYNISNGEPILIWDFIRRIAEGLQLPPPRGHVPLGMLRTVAGLSESALRLLRPADEPMLTRYGIEVLGLTTTLNIDKARCALGYEPHVSVEAGLRTLLDHYRAHGVPEVA